MLILTQIIVKVEVDIGNISWKQAKVIENLAEAYDNSTNLHDYRLSVFVPEPLLYTSLPCSCHIYFINPFFHSGEKGGNHTLFWGLSVPWEVPRCSASVLPLLASFFNSVNKLAVCTQFWHERLAFGRLTGKVISGH